MSNKFQNNSDWQLSIKGNYWKKHNGVVLVVGGSDENGYWVRIGNKFLSNWEITLQDAKKVAESEARLWF